MFITVKNVGYLRIKHCEAEHLNTYALRRKAQNCQPVPVSHNRLTFNLVSWDSIPATHRVQRIQHTAIKYDEARKPPILEMFMDCTPQCTGFYQSMSFCPGYCILCTLHSCMLYIVIVFYLQCFQEAFFMSI